MIVDKQLVVSNRKKSDIVADLRKHNLRPFPKVSSAKNAGETEEAAEDEEREDVPGGDADYDYLLGMAIWSLTKERIEKLRQQASDKEKELLVLLEKTPKDMWNLDLDLFLKAWEVWLFLLEWLAGMLMGITGRLCRVRTWSRSRWQREEGETKASGVANPEIDRGKAWI